MPFLKSLRVALFLSIAVTILPGANGCGGTASPERTICSSDAACGEGFQCTQNECVEIAQHIDITPTDAETRYLNHWMDEQENFVARHRWLPHFIHEQGELGICMRFEFDSERTVDGELVESIRRKIEDRVWEFQKGLIGEPNWTRTEKTPVKLFGIGITPQVNLVDAPDVPVYENAAAECPSDCFRFTYKNQAEPLFENCDHPSMWHFDFNIWYSDFSFGAAGHGGDWGTRLDWNQFMSELNDSTPRVTDHELGHVAGMPDVYNYPMTLDGHWRPSALMAHSSSMKDLDILMLRKVWELGWERFYSDSP